MKPIDTLVLIKHFHESGVTKSEHYEFNGMKHGVERLWCEDGSLLSECSFVHGKLHGIARLFTETGIVYVEENFENGVRHGEYISRWDSGGLKEHGFYIHGQRQPGYKYYREDGCVWRESPPSLDSSDSMGSDSIEKHPSDHKTR